MAEDVEEIDFTRNYSLGELFRYQGQLFIVTTTRSDGERIIATNIPEGMTEMDLGRRFFAAVEIHLPNQSVIGGPKKIH